MDVGIFGESQESSDASVVISVAENRSREICISKICSDSSNNLEIFLTADSHSYMNTLSIIADTKPDEILLHDGSRNNVLSKKIENEFATNSMLFAPILIMFHEIFINHHVIDAIVQHVFNACVEFRAVPDNGKNLPL